MDKKTIKEKEARLKELEKGIKEFDQEKIQDLENALIGYMILNNQKELQIGEIKVSLV